MKNNKMMLFFSLMVFTGCQKSSLSKNDIDLVSFHRGYTFWNETLALEKMPYNVSQVIQGIRAAERGEKLTMDQEGFSQALQRFQKEFLIRKKEENLAMAESFLQHVSQEAIELIPSKLYFKRIKDGEGKTIDREDAPFFIYSAKTIEKGKEVEIYSSEETPIQISLADTIPGFAEGVVGMKKGEKRILYIHPDLTQGEYSFLPNQILLMEVELQ